jgi:hypothetical protein
MRNGYESSYWLTKSLIINCLTNQLTNQPAISHLDLKGGCKAEKVAFLQQNVLYCCKNREVVRMKQSIRFQFQVCDLRKRKLGRLGFESIENETVPIQQR